MTKEEAAELLDGREYRDEIDFDFAKKLAQSNLIAVYGASDDIMCMSGATNDEFYGPQYLSSGGVFYNKCEDDCCPYFHKAKDSYPLIVPIWPEDDCFRFKLTNNVPSAEFRIMEDGEIYCIGKVIDCKDLPA